MQSESIQPMPFVRLFLPFFVTEVWEVNRFPWCLNAFIGTPILSTSVAGLNKPSHSAASPHSLSTVLRAHPSATALAEVLASANSNLGFLWVDRPNPNQSAALDILDAYCQGVRCDGKTHLRKISKNSLKHPMFWLGWRAIPRRC